MAADALAESGLRRRRHRRADEAGVAAAPDPDRGRYHALLIGIDYQDSSWLTRLKSPEHDVDRLAWRLENQFGFEPPTILLHERATKSAIEKAFQDYLQSEGAGRLVQPSDSLLIYFAGHGTRSDHDEDLTFWLPHDAREGDEEGWVRGDDVIDWIQRIDAAHVLLISDSCYSGGLRFRSGGEEDAELRRNAERKLNYLLREESVQVISSGADHEKVSDKGDWPGAKLSLFAGALDTELDKVVRSGDAIRYITASELHIHVRDSAIEKSPRFRAQGPQVHRSPARGYGEFIFIAQGASDAAHEEGAAIRRMEGWPFGWRIPGTLVPLGFVDLDGNESATPLYTLKGEDRTEMVMVTGDKYFTPFLMDRHEVTNARFREFLKSRGREDDIEHWQRERDPEFDRRPVVGIDLETAREFARWAGKQLPTEAQWMHAATWDADRRAMRAFPWGDEFEAGELERLLRPPVVGATSGDDCAFGLVAMGGGVREWCLLPPPADPAVFGVACGPTQVFSSVRARWGSAVAEHRFEVRANERRNNLGFRCVFALEK